MSFSSELKDYIIENQYKNACCRRSLLWGILCAKGQVDENFVLRLSVDGENTIKLIQTLLGEIYNIEPLIERPRAGGRCKELSFRSKSVATVLGASNIDTSIPGRFKCSYCKSAFLRGVFLVCGRASDPQKQFCLEFSIVNKSNGLSELLSSFDIDLKYTQRRNEKILYTKNSNYIEDFFALAELNDAAFSVMNQKISNDLKNEANRVRNFETVNIMRTVEAANAQYTVIRELYEKNLFSKLPDELRATAILRLKNPEMSLAQLAMHSIPPLTKSGITHRMNKIVKLARELLLK